MSTLADRLEALEAAIAEDARRDLSTFSQEAWGHVEHGEMVWGQHIEAICDHLQAVSEGAVQRLIINVPPRHMKSLNACVFWPCWEWASRASTKFLFASYNRDLAIRDNVRSRRLLESNWYRRHYGVRLAPDQNTKTRFDNTAGGYRIAISVGTGTGEGGDILVIDDPLSADQARSARSRAEAVLWFNETARFRLNDPKRARIVIIMQRLHEDDLTGHILARETGWDHLCLPGFFEPDHPHPVRSSIGFRDWREADGEILWPERFGEKELREIAPEGSYQFAGQVQQRPAPREGGLFKIGNIARLRDAPKIVRAVRRWDLAATEGGGDWTVGTLLGEREDGLGWVILDVARGQWGAGEVRRRIYAVAEADRALPYPVRLVLPQDPGAAGKDQRDSFARFLAPFGPRFVREQGDKETRAEPFAAQVELGKIAVIEAGWTDPFIGELASFPRGSHDDQVDSAAGAFTAISARPAARIGTFSGI